MATWIGGIVLLTCAGLFGGIIWAIVYALNATAKAVSSTKENLKNKGLHITDTGVSVKTNKRFDREHYVDATQRGLIKAMEASSFGPQDVPQDVVRTNSSGSPTQSEEVEKKKGIFGRKKRAKQQ